MDKKKTIDDTAKYPGMAADSGVDTKPTPTEVIEDVRELNNNPRDNDDKMP